MGALPPALPDCSGAENQCTEECLLGSASDVEAGQCMHQPTLADSHRRLLPVAQQITNIVATETACIFHQRHSDIRDHHKLLPLELNVRLQRRVSSSVTTPSGVMPRSAANQSQLPVRMPKSP